MKQFLLDVLGWLNIIDWCHIHHKYMTPHGFYDEHSDCDECKKGGEY